MKAIIALLIVPLSATMAVADNYQIFTLNAVPGSRQHYSYGALVVNETSAAMYSCLGTMALKSTMTAVSCSKVATKNGINLPPGPAALSPYSTAQHRKPISDSLEGVRWDGYILQYDPEPWSGSPY